MKTKDLIQYRLERSQETLEVAEELAEKGHWFSCVNRLYYACFYAVNALLLSKGFSSSKHSGVRGLLNLHFIKTGIISKEYGKLFNDLFEYRQQSDYEDLFDVDIEIIRPWISLAKEFITFIKNLLLNNKEK